MHELKTVHGWKFPACDEFMSRELKSDGTYQSSHLHMALEYVTNWSLALSCGAHVGTWTKLLSAKFERVIAIEPSADTFEALTLNMQTFGCSNVELRNVAVGAVAGTVSMVLDGRAAELKNTGARYVSDGGDVPLEVIDDWQLQSLGFLKMDIEGSEAAALQGARETITRCQPIVLYENKQLWRRFGVPSNGPETVLSSLGYRLLARAGCDLIYGPAKQVAR